MATKQEPTQDLTDGRKADILPAQLLPTAVPRDRNKEKRAGYECEFVEPPPSVLQTECPVCLLVLKEPCLISCCGYKFCQGCIERIEKDKKSCPLCNKPKFTFMQERMLERSLKDLEVWCSYRKEGCEWKGKLGKLEEHLNQDPSPENRLNGCQFVAVECTNKCGAWFQRRHIPTHETRQCKKRPYSCDHCRDYHSTFEDVTEVHYHQCGKYPVACPNDCDVQKIERQNMESHLKEQCLLEVLDCPFAGCGTRLPRKDMPDHSKENVIHFTLLATATQKLSTENQKLMKENQELQQKMRERDNEFKEEIKAVCTSLQKLNEKTSSVVTSFEEIVQRKDQFDIEIQRINQKLQEITDTLHVTENEVRAIKEGIPNQKLEIQQLINQCVFPIDFHAKFSDEAVYLPAFNPHCYRMCLKVYPNGNGFGKGTHVSIYTYLMQGPFDDYLKWPFRGEITIQIVNQVGDHDHVERVIRYTDKASNDSAGRVTGKERADSGKGYSEFFAHDELQYNAEMKTQYLKDDTLHIRVVKVKLT